MFLTTLDSMSTRDNTKEVFSMRFNYFGLTLERSDEILALFLDAMTATLLFLGVWEAL